MADLSIKGIGGSGLELITSTSAALDVNIKSGTATTASTPTKGTLTDRSGSIASGTVAQTLAAANATRKYFLFVNQSAGNMWLNFTTTAIMDQPSILIVPNGSLVMEAGFISTELISVIGATTGQKWMAKES